MDTLVTLLVALIRLVPDLLGVLDPAHPVTKKVKEILPVRSESEKAFDELSRQEQLDKG